MAAAPRCPSLLVLMLLLLLSCCGALSAAADVKLTHLHFYTHEVFVGPNATVATVASLHKNATTTAPAFGDVFVFDNAVREGPDPASRLIGRAQGINVRASLVGSGASGVMTFVFSGDHAKYSGSTLATQGYFDASGAPSERSIVGGTGKLRFARGYMKDRLLSANGTVVVAYDLYFTLAH